MSGGKIVLVDDVKWATMPDAQMTVNALMTNEIDYIEQVQNDLVPMLRGYRQVVLEVRDSQGFQGCVRMNLLIPPFNNGKIRIA